jgi:hypothetical protein
MALVNSDSKGEFKVKTYEAFLISISTVSMDNAIRYKSQYTGAERSPGLAHGSSPVWYQSYHFVEAGRVLQTVSYVYQGPFLVILFCPDVVELNCQFLDVGSKVFYCLQAVCEVTERQAGLEICTSIRFGPTRKSDGTMGV